MSDRSKTKLIEMLNADRFGAADMQSQANLFDDGGETNASPAPSWQSYLTPEYTPELAKKYINFFDKEFFGKYPSYDDFIKATKSSSYDALVKAAKTSNVDLMNKAKLYYNTPEAKYQYAYLDMKDAMKSRDAKRAQMIEDAGVAYPTEGKTWRLNSLNDEGKPNNKHRLLMNEVVMNYIFDEAVRGGVDPKTALMIAVNESNLGNAKRDKDAFNLMSYWAGIGGIRYPNSHFQPYYDITDRLKRGESLTEDDYNAMREVAAKYRETAARMKPYDGDNVIADAVRFYENGFYPGSKPSDPNSSAYKRWQKRNEDYTALLEKRWDELNRDPRFVDWYNARLGEIMPMEPTPKEPMSASFVGVPVMDGSQYYRNVESAMPSPELMRYAYGGIVNKFDGGGYTKQENDLYGYINNTLMPWIVNGGDIWADTERNRQVRQYLYDNGASAVLDDIYNNYTPEEKKKDH